MKVFLDLLWFFKQEKKAYLTGIFILGMVAFLELIPPKVIGIIVDHIDNRTLSKRLILEWLMVIILAGLAMYALRYCWRIMIFGSSVKLSMRLRNQLFDHFTRMPQTFYQRRRIGDLMAHATNDLQAIQQTAGMGVLTLFDSLTVGSFVIATMAVTISWKLTLICLIPMPLMAVLTNVYGKYLHKRFHKAQEAFSSLNDKVQESINGIKVIISFGQEKEDVDDFRRLSNDVVVKNIEVAKIDSLYNPTISIVVALSFFLAVSFGSRYVISGELSIGDLISFTTYLGLLIWPMLAFGWLFNIVERGRASYDRVSKLLNNEGEILDGEALDPSLPSGDIQFNIDEFSYPDDREPVLTDVSFTIKKGSTLGIAGKTGSGKTTILKLFIREFEGKNAHIIFGEKPITQYKIENTRAVIGYVPQDHFLFSATIAENIAFAKYDASIDEIMKAAKVANIHEDIMLFTNQYETVVGERGISLSGGQRQRISIARALLLNPEVLILDDSLSAVDAKTEESILNSLKQNRNGKTTIITSHRLSSIQHADLIIVLDKGRMSEKGTHEELMAQNGWYREMYFRQQLEDLVEHGG